jgi:carboxypeptidase Taq
MMPPGGVRARAEQLATLERLFHERLTAAEVEDWLQRLTGGDDVGEGEQAVPAGEPDTPTDRDAALIRVARRARDKALRVPISLRSELARARSANTPGRRRARPTTSRRSCRSCARSSR